MWCMGQVALGVGCGRLGPGHAALNHDHQNHFLYSPFSLQEIYRSLEFALPILMHWTLKSVYRMYLSRRKTFRVWLISLSTQPRLPQWPGMASAPRFPKSSRIEHHTACSRGSALRGAPAALPGGSELVSVGEILRVAVGSVPPRGRHGPSLDKWLLVSHPMWIAWTVLQMPPGDKVGARPRLAVRSAPEPPAPSDPPPPALGAGQAHFREDGCTCSFCLLAVGRCIPLCAIKAHVLTSH